MKPPRNPSTRRPVRARKYRKPAGLISMNQVLRTDYFAAWLDKTGVRGELNARTGQGPWTARQLRDFLEENRERLGLQGPLLRRFKRAAVLILSQL
ncbi:MAG: hypothetical protein ACOYMV_13895 [Verrucomicrobiia bacterium]